MNYKDLFKAIDWFKHDTYAYDSAYIRSRKITNWRNLHTFSDEEIARKVFSFLNDWKCRIGVTKEVVKRIKEAYSEIIPYIRSLENEVLENTAFEREILVGGVPIRISDAINISMDTMIGVGHRFRHVAASRLLHIVNPALFVMWDNSIIMNYKLSSDANSYAYEFMPLMQQVANEAIETYMKDNNNCNQKQAIERIKEYGAGKTLAKLVDEFNYWKFSSGTRV